ncbi:restriction endonuclease subunit S [Aerococcus urinaeequi]|uniref:restriction endonuclease subunit S n=1 Tax=Aerococcus urinaeequi TaxID=51665 RepID=UPI0008461473|nr:restriction endonuclease subunit S [Aerococcus urinaeequi]
MIDTKALREKILDLAMCGKLVPQNPNDEPASELLKRIKEEKEELIKQKKIKRDKNESEIFRGDDGFYYEKFADEVSEEIVIPYEIPQNWSWCRIVTATKNISSGGDKPKQVSMKQTDEFPYPIFSNGIKDNGLYGYSKEAKIFEKSVTVSARGTIGFTAIRNEPYTPIVRLISIIPPQGKLDVGFLKYMLSYLIPVGEGTSIPQLTVPGLKPFLIALPPYQEQLKIVDAINEYFILIDEIEENQKSLAEQLKKKVLDVAMQGKLVPQDSDDEPASFLLEKIRVEKQKLYEEGKLKKKDLEETSIVKDEDNSYYGKLPESWLVSSLLDVTLRITDGSHNPPKDSGEGVQIISGKNIINDKVEFSLSNRWVTHEQFEKEDARTQIRKRDLLLTIVGTIGLTAVVSTDIPFTAQRSVAVLKTPSTFDSRYTKIIFDAPIIQNFLQSKSSGTAQKGVYLATIKQIKIPIAPAKEQGRIVEKVNQVNQILLNFQ